MDTLLIVILFSNISETAKHCKMGRGCQLRFMCTVLIVIQLLNVGETAKNCRKRKGLSVAIHGHGINGDFALEHR